MPQGLLPFKYETEKRESGLTARVLLHANRLVIHVAAGADIYAALLHARTRMMMLAIAPALG